MITRIGERNRGEIRVFQYGGPAKVKVGREKNGENNDNQGRVEEKGKRRRKKMK